MRLVLISDTHGLHTRMPAIPEGDVLIHAGDLTGTNTMEETAVALDWLDALPHPHKILVAGNQAAIAQGGGADPLDRSAGPPYREELSATVGPSAMVLT